MLYDVDDKDNSPARKDQPTKGQLADRTWNAFRDIYRQLDLVGSHASLAIDKAATRLEQGRLAPKTQPHLINFQLPQATKKALDYAVFFKDYRPQFAKLKRQSASHFGACQSFLAVNNKTEAARHLRSIADLEGQIASLFSY